MTPVSSHSGQRGFTLVEMIISAGLIGFLAVGATWFWANGFTLVRTVNADSMAIAEARAALERVAREIREVKNSGAAYCVGTLPTTQPATTFTFKKSCVVGVSGCAPAVVGCTTSTCAPMGGACGSNDHDVTVRTVNGNLTLSYAGALASPAVADARLAGNVTSFGVRFLDSANVAASGSGADASVRFVEVSLTVQPTDSPATSVRTVIGLRNN